jgi:UDP-N-acetylglucosamine--N-acetylmuramyl-(pentapeptide) pyrophosphoryl-undecaprenol N-acetylglucosamine transferase
LVTRAGVPFNTIPAAGVHGVGLRALPGNLWRLGRGYLEARRILANFRPEALLFTGGYIAVPVALAGRGIPSLLYVPDIEPGLAIQALARFTNTIAVTAPDSRRFFPERSRRKLAVTGYPVRPDLKDWNRARARQFFELSAELPVLLAFGGSKGARSINRAVLAVLPELLDEMQVVHISGPLDWAEVEARREKLSSTHASRYRAFSYLHDEMGAALGAADLALSRAGASCLGEFPAFGLPAVLVPYPHAWRYQQVNAEYLSRGGAALIVQDADLPSRLLPVVLDLARNPGKREQMRQAMLSMAKPEAARSIANLLMDMVGQGRS